MHHAQPHLGLHTASLAGDDDAVRRALDNGADVNALDSTGRTSLMCAIAGDHWQDIDASGASFMTPNRLNAIRLLLRHPNITLFTLNAPQSSMNGVIPLGMSAWLDMEEAVRLLLEESAGAVSVDGMDTHGATALMYAARDGGLSVVQLLLSHGARPDFRERNHRSCIQFALGYPQILWLFESILRRHRWRESQSADRSRVFPGSEDLLDLAYSAIPSDTFEPPPLSIFTSQAASKLTNILIPSIISSELSFLRSLLFSPAIPSSSPPGLYPMSAPILINQPDIRGWSPIHYCASISLPSVYVLDALYCAGADMALFTTHEHFTPLHILARSAHLSLEDSEHTSSLYNFTVHLIRDLRAPLSARDKDDETCIHLAAEHGTCIELLQLLLDFDTTGSVRELRNSRGLTALEVSKLEFRSAFGEDLDRSRSVSSLSTHTVRAMSSFSSLVSVSDWKPAIHDAVSLCSPLDLDLEESAHQLLFSLRATSLHNDHYNDSETIGHFANYLSEASHLSQGIISQFRSRVREAKQELQELRNNAWKVNILQDTVTRAAIEKVGEDSFDAYYKRKRDSEDSQMTVLNQSSRNTSTLSIAKSGRIDESHISVATQTTTMNLIPNRQLTSVRRPLMWAEWLDGFMTRSTDSSTYATYLENLTELERDLALRRLEIAASETAWDEPTSPPVDVKLRDLMKKHKKLERELDTAERKMKKASSATKGTPQKVKSWLKRFITQDRPTTKLEIVYDVDDPSCAVGRQVKSAEDCAEFNDPEDDEGDNTLDSRVAAALRTSSVILNASKRDLHSIDDRLDAAEQLLTLGNQSILRAERVIIRAIKKRETMLAAIRDSSTSSDLDQKTYIGLGSPGLLGYNLLPSRPSSSSLSSVYSSQSSCPSIALTVMENDDEDTRIIRRLLLRKIEAGVAGSWDEMDQVRDWLCIVKEAVKGVKRRAYL